MTNRRATRLLFAVALGAIPALAGAQKAEKPPKAKKVASDSSATPALFTSEAPLAVTFTANWDRLRGDKGETSPWRTATMAYTATDGKVVSTPLKVKTHGIWRLKHCNLPPLRLNFSNKETKHSVFHDLQKPKMVSTCKDNDGYEQLVLKEMQLYRVYQAVTPVSHRVRLLRVSYADSATGKADVTRYAFLFEDPDEMADRLDGKLTKAKGARSDDFDTDALAVAYVFEYFIGNLDFSFNGVHNAEIIVKSDGSTALPVAYDFDFSGAVNAPYATVDPQFRSKRVIDRVFRGSCGILQAYPAAIARFRDRKDAIYALYHDPVGSLLAPGTIRESLEYFDQFYEDVKTPKDAESNVLSSCVRSR
ncbi:MAG: hypothetical protein M3Z05_10580 [Gemmatimonadota bacterium]|nr:hypothetical protein [Gemmatimonadota bacterium]